MSRPHPPAALPIPPAGRLRRLMVAWMVFGCVLGGVVSVAGLAGGWWWAFDLANHFQAQYFGFQMLCVVGFLLFRRFRWALVAAALLSLPAVRLAPYYISDHGSQGPPPTAPGTRLRVVSFNVLSSNPQHAGTLAWVRQLDPDLAFFPEVTAGWEAGLAPLKTTMPHCLSHPEQGNFGWALFSKHPLLAHEALPGRLMESAVIRVVVEVAGRRVEFYGAHPVPPLSAALAQDRDAVLRQLADGVGRGSGPVIVAGDLNATRWSEAMRPLFAAGLRDTQLGHGFSATWQRGIPVFAIPIDHLLVGGGINATARWTGPDLGSDHRPVVADLRLPADGTATTIPSPPATTRPANR